MVTTSPHRCRPVWRGANSLVILCLVGVPLVGCDVASTPAPRNIIVMIGDGMGFNQVDLASLYRDGTSNFQVTVEDGAAATSAMPRTPSLPFESFEVQTAVSTYSVNGSYDPALAWSDPSYVDQAPTDSAAAATAMASGVKTYDAAIGVDANQQPVELLAERAAALGKATGVVTTVPFSHATPAGFSAHETDRDHYRAITRDYLNSDLDVVMGAGHPMFTDDHTRADADYKYVSKADWAALTTGATPFTFIEDGAGFRALVDSANPPDRVFGVAQVATTLQERRSGALGAEPYAVPFNDVPDLTTLSLGALNVLGQDPDGMFLMIEGGAIDWAGHDSSAARLIEEELAFDDAVQAVVDWVERESSWEQTLLIVTADHETGHLTAPGFEHGWAALTGSPGQVPAHVWNSEDHTDALVPLSAQGVGAQALAARADSTDPVRGPYLDNTEIAEVVLDELWE